MYRLALLFTVFFALNATAKINNDSYYLNIDSIEVIELEEEVEFNFNPKDYLPKGFNALKGMHDLDSHKIHLVLIEIQEEFGYNLNDKIFCSL